MAAFLIVVYYSFRLEISAYFYTFERLKGASSGFKISYIKSKEFIGCYTRTMVLLAIITAVPCIVAGMIVISAQGQSKWIAVAVIALIAGYLLCMLALAPIVSIAEPSESHCIKRSRTITEGNLLSILLIYGLWIIILYGPGILMFGRQYPAAKDVASILESMFNTAINIVMTAVLPMLYNQIMAVRKENKNMLKKAAL